MLEKLKDLIAEQLDVEKDKITEESNFSEDLGVDSLELFELVMSLEDTFEVEIPSEDLEKIATVGDAIAYIEENSK